MEESSLNIILRARDEASATVEKAGLSIGGIAKAAALTGVIAAAAIVAIAAEATKMAADFQYTTETLVTGAGEDQKALNMVRDGVLALAGQVGQTPQHLAEGLYLIESAGFHGAHGLEVLKAAAMGATVGAADMAAVSDALTSALNAYRLPATDAAHITDVLLTTVAAGKMHLSDLAANIGKVLPIAAAAHVPITELGAAIATMTAQGTDAAMATTALRFLITNLIAPSSAAAGVMKHMGLSAKELYNDLSTKGLTGALQDIQEHLSKKFPVGSQQYIAALDKMVGGTRGMTAALELTGPNMKTFVANAQSIGHASDGAGKLMEGWKEHSTDFNIVMDRLKAGLAAVMITIGNQVLPVATQFAKWFVDNLPNIQKFADEGVARVKKVLQDSVPYVNAVRDALGFVKDHMNVIAPVLGTIVGLWVAWNVGLAITKALQAATLAVQFVAGLIAIVSKVGLVTAAQWLWNLALTANPIGLIIIGIAALVAIIVLALTHTKEIGQAFSWLGTQAKAVWDVIVTDVNSMVASVVGFLTGLWDKITGIWTSLTTGVETAWKAFSSRPIYYIVLLAADAIKFLIGLYNSVMKWGGDMVQSAVNTAFGFMQGSILFFAQLPGKILTFLGGLLISIGLWEQNMVLGAIKMGGDFIKSVIDFFSTLPGKVGTWLGSTVKSITDAIPKINAEAGKLGKQFVDTVIKFLAELPGKVAAFIAAALGNVGGQVASALHDAHVPGFASGAVVRAGSGGVVARIGEGAEDEVVATASQMAAVGANIAGSGGGGGEQTIVVPVNIDGRMIAQVVAKYQGKQFNLQGGRLGSGAG